MNKSKLPKGKNSKDILKVRELLKLLLTQHEIQKRKSVALESYSDAAKSQIRMNILIFFSFLLDEEFGEQ